MRETFLWSASETRTECASLRLVLVSLDVRMCRILDWPRMILPVPVFLKRFAAPRCVLSLGIGNPDYKLRLDNILQFIGRSELRPGARIGGDFCVCPSLPQGTIMHLTQNDYRSTLLLRGSDREPDRRN